MPALSRTSASAPLVRLDLSEQAYEVLRERIVSRQLGPGERLSLQALADELGVSRSPVHHALTRLVEAGLVTTSRRGYEVRPLTPALVRDTHETRLAIELYAVQAVAGGISDGQRRLLEERLRPTLYLVEGTQLVDRRGYIEANRTFHETIVELAGNAILTDVYRRLHVHDLFDRSIVGLGTTDAGKSTEEHTAIVAAIVSGDAAAASAAVRANIATGLRLTLDALDLAGGVL